MNAFYRVIALVLFLAAAPSPCYAMRLIASVSKKEAKELGVQLRMKAAGSDVWVEIEFKKEGKFAEFQGVELSIREGGKLLLGYAPLREEQASGGGVLARLLADGSQLNKIVLTIVAGDVGDTGYELALKDFVETK